MSTSEKRRKSGIVMVRVTPEEHAAVREKARDAGLTVPAFVLACALARTTRSDADAHIMNELRKLGESQRRLCHDPSGPMAAAQAAVLVEIIAAIKRVGG
jgi:hypothetical protein